MKEAFIVWLVAVMNMMAPAHREHPFVLAQETYEQADARYQEIASAIIEVSYDKEERPLFAGPDGRANTALFIAHKFWLESGFRRDVQTGLGREKNLVSGLNDHGRSWCLGQLNLGIHQVSLQEGEKEYDSVNTTREGWTGRELVDDLHKCVKASLHLMRASFGSCPQLGPDGRLTVYAAGVCENERGQRISKDRFSSYRTWKNRTRPLRPQVHDSDFLQWLEAPVVPEEVGTISPIAEGQLPAASVTSSLR